MEQDSLNVTAKFKATVELLVDLHGTVCVAILSCLLLRGRLGLFRLRRLSLTNLSRVKYLSGEDFIVGFTRIPFAYQMSTVIIRLAFHK